MTLGTAWWLPSHLKSGTMPRWSAAEVAASPPATLHSAAEELLAKLLNQSVYCYPIGLNPFRITGRCSQPGLHCVRPALNIEYSVCIASFYLQLRCFWPPAAARWLRRRRSPLELQAQRHGCWPSCFPSSAVGSSSYSGRPRRACVSRSGSGAAVGESRRACSTAVICCTPVQSKARVNMQPKAAESLSLTKRGTAQGSWSPA